MTYAHDMPCKLTKGFCASSRCVFAISRFDRFNQSILRLYSCPGVSTVHGNASLEKVTTNCLRVMRALNKTNIPVHAGLGRGLTRENISATNIHGKSGLDGTILLPPLQLEDKPSGKKAVLAIAEEVLAWPKGEVILVATGSMTNIAILVSLFPEVVDWIKALVIMGGALCVGNVTSVAEFNIWVTLREAIINR